MWSDGASLWFLLSMVSSLDDVWLVFLGFSVYRALFLRQKHSIEIFYKGWVFEYIDLNYLLTSDNWYHSLLNIELSPDKERSNLVPTEHHYSI